jgi:predicted SprT family Zn-dependent metalloprotease
MESAIQLSLPLLDPPTFDGLLEKRRAQNTLSIITSRRLKLGWRVKVLPFSGKRQLVIPHYLTEAPEEVKDSLIDWALLPCRPNYLQKKSIREHRSLLEKKIWHYIDSLPDAPHRRSRFNPDSLSGKTSGQRYDLQEVFHSVNHAYFNGTLSALVRWGHAYSKTSCHTVKKCSNGLRFNLITIAGAYNNPEVPRYAIEGIMHHEMLHIAVPPYKKNGRNVIHGKEFKDGEKKFSCLREWRKWEQEKLPILLRQSRRKQRGTLTSELPGSIL